MKAKLLLANHGLHATWLIGALFEFFARILVRFVAEVLSPHRYAALAELRKYLLLEEIT